MTGLRPECWLRRDARRPVHRHRAEEIESSATPERLPLLTRAEADLALAVLDVVAGGSMDDEVRSAARALRSRLGLRLCTEGRTPV
ncbi:hypothetical protein SF23_20040 [Streptomyces sp. MBRL 10]|nr:hypothetical protein SF23_20040 [Streptomyces sp. MBRL 10]